MAQLYTLQCQTNVPPAISVKYYENKKTFFSFCHSRIGLLDMVLGKMELLIQSNCLAIYLQRQNNQQLLAH